MCLCVLRRGGAAPPIIKLACCAGGPCLQGSRGSFLHSVDRSERGEGSSQLSHSLLSLVIFCNSFIAALRLRPAQTGSSRTSQGGKQQQQQQHLPNPLPPSSLPARIRTSSLLPPPLPPLPSCATVSTWPSPIGTPPPQGRVGIALSALFSLLL